MFERLTRIDAGGIITGAKRGRGEYVGTQEMLERLYEYENSNLSPEEVQSLAQAKADRRLVVLPVKVGDAVWKIKSAFSYFTKPMEDRVERIIIYKNEILVCCTSGAKFSIGSVGKAVFLSREEAEKALEVKEP